MLRIWFYRLFRPFFLPLSLVFILLCHITPVSTANSYDFLSKDLTLTDSVLAVNDTYRLQMNKPDSFAVTLNDTSYSSPAHTLTISELPLAGAARVVSDSVIYYRPTQDFSGRDSLQYSLSDTSGFLTHAWVFIEVVDTVESLKAHADTVFLSEDDTLLIDVLANDVFSEDLHSLQLVKAAQNGLATVRDRFFIQYIPVTNFFGTDSLQYVIESESGLLDSAYVLLSIEAVNDAPVARKDSIGSAEDSSLVVFPLQNDFDVEGDSIALAFFSAPAHGSLELLSDSSLHYTPSPNYFGADSFYYHITDPSGQMDSAKVVLQLEAVNDPPFAVNDSAGIFEDQVIVIYTESSSEEASKTTGTSQYSLLNTHLSKLTEKDTLRLSDEDITNLDLLTNDSDLEQELLSIKDAWGVLHGHLEFYDTAIVYTPNTNYNGHEQFFYLVEDASGGKDTALVDMNITPVNDMPVASADTVITNENDTVTYNLLVNDLDVEGDELALTYISTDENVQTRILSDGLVAFEPAKFYQGTQLFTYYISDQHGGADTSTVYVQVLNVDHPPKAKDDEFSTLEDSVTLLDVLANDKDPDKDPLELTWVSEANHGLVTISDGQLQYDPPKDFFGEVIVFYALQDITDLSDTAQVTIQVLSVNDQPLAVNDSAQINEDEQVWLFPLENDSDVETLRLNLIEFTSPNHGSLSLHQGDSVLYVPDSDFHGSDSFTYTLSDEEGAQASAQVFLQLQSVNDAPYASDDFYEVSEEQELTVEPLENDTDVDGDDLLITSVTQVSHGTVSLVDNQYIVYQPESNFNGEDRFQYYITDSNNAMDSATVVFQVSAENDPPQANEDAITLDEDSEITIDVLANDTDVDNVTLSISSFTQTANGMLTLTQENELHYVPDANYHGQEEFSYTVADSLGLQSTAEVTITILSVNDAPQAQDDRREGTEDQSMTIQVLDNDLDVDGDLLRILDYGLPTNGQLTLTDDAFQYQPDRHFHGIDSFYYSIEDVGTLRDTALVIISLEAVNDAPQALNDSLQATEDTPLVIDALANDTDADNEELSITYFDQPENGSVDVQEDNSFLYTPDLNFTGTDGFNYTIEDAHGVQASARVIITRVVAVNDAPFASNDSYQTTEGDTLLLNVLQNDQDPDGDPLLIMTYSQPANGFLQLYERKYFKFFGGVNFNGEVNFDYSVTDQNGGVDTAQISIVVSPENDAPDAFRDEVSVNEDNSVLVDVLANDSDVDGDMLSLQEISDPRNGTASIESNKISYTPEQNYFGSDSLRYTINDGKGGSASAWLVITDIFPVNDAPVAVVDAVSTLEDESLIINILDNDQDADNDDLHIVEVDAAENGTVVIQNDKILYTPQENFFGSDSFYYTISDGRQTSTAQVIIDPISAQNDAPIAQDDFVNSLEGDILNIEVLQNDSDIDGDELEILYIENIPDVITFRTGQTIRFIPDNDLIGLIEFRYAVGDPGGSSDTAVVKVYIGEVNAPPVAVNDEISLNEDESVSVSVLANDSDPDDDQLTLVEVSEPQNGRIVIEGQSLLYTPQADYFGPDSVSYRVFDGNGNISQAWLFIEVRSVNDLPVAIDDFVQGFEDEELLIEPLLNDYDIDNSQLTLAGFNTPQNGEVEQGNQSLIYRPTTDYNGDVEFTYYISDGLDTVNATIFLTIEAVNDPPIAVSDTFYISEDQTTTIDPLQNDTDVDADRLVIESVGEVSHGDITISNNQLIYTPASEFNGWDSFTYRITDGGGAYSSATVYLNVSEQNDPPLSSDDFFSMEEDGELWLNVLTNDRDPEGDPLTITDFSDPLHGEIEWKEGKAIYLPETNFFGQDSLRYEVSDGVLSSFSTIYISVSAVNDAPRAINDTVRYAKNSTVLVNVLINDSDPENDRLNVTEVSAASGTVSIDGENRLVYDPPRDFTGFITLEYSISDGTYESSAVVYLEIYNSPPQAVDDEFFGQEDRQLKLDVLKNDQDAEGDRLTIYSFVNPLHGTIERIADQLLYIPDADFSGVDTFNYTIEDISGGRSTALVTLTIEALNDAPVPIGNEIDIKEDQTQFISVNDIAEDVDTKNLQLLWLSEPRFGTIQAATESGFNYLPEKDFYGLDSLNFLVTDGEFTTDTVTLYLNVLSINDKPVALNDTVSTQEDQALTIDLLQNDFDVDSPELIVSNFTEAEHGQVLVKSNQTVVYTPESDYVGKDAFTYTISDQGGLKATARVIINEISPVNDAPLALADTFEVTNSTDLKANLLENDFDKENDPLILLTDPLTMPAHGSIELFEDGRMHYIPDEDFAGRDRFVYQIKDQGEPEAFAQAEVVIDVVLNSEYITTTIRENTSWTYSFEMLKGESYRLDSIIRPAQQGELIFASDSLSMLYQPSINYTGEESFSLRLCALNSAECIQLTVKLEVLPIDQVIVYEALTPDGDGKNDIWLIEGIQHYPDNKVRIFDMDGLLIYSIAAYDNVKNFWAGQYSPSTGVSRGEVPAGSYFYLIDLGDGTSLSGALLLVR